MTAPIHLPPSLKLRRTSRRGFGGQVGVSLDEQEWRDIASAPDGKTIRTVIRDEHGERNDALLKRVGNLWFYPAGDMYVYYRPTHWRPA